jgi:hypothetical protein
MNPTAGNTRTDWNPPAPAVTFDVTVDAAAPSPDAPVCYTATSPQAKDAVRPRCPEPGRRMRATGDV